MKLKGIIFKFSIILSAIAVTNANSTKQTILPQWVNPVVTLQGGYAAINMGNNTHRYVGMDNDIFTYKNSNSTKDTGFFGAFLGTEYPCISSSYPGLFMRAGAEYNAFSNVDVSGSNAVGIEPQTSTLYKYNYNFSTQQVLGVFKLFSTFHERFYPYAEAGLGAAFNRAWQYRLTQLEAGSINLSPIFDGRTKSQFSYIFGVGIETQLRDNIHLGIGYRYSNFGSLSLGKGIIGLNNYRYTMPFNLRNNSIYANQLVAQISYVL